MGRISEKKTLEKVSMSQLDKVLDLVDGSFDADRSVLERDLRGIIASPETQGEVYGLWIGDHLIACVAYGRYYMEGWNGEGGISHLVVDKDFRRKGLGTQIILQALFDLKSSGAPCVCITVKVGDSVALNMWKRYGFELYDPAYESEGYGMYEGYVLWFKEGDRWELVKKI